jgi:hypothetical protein
MALPSYAMYEPTPISAYDDGAPSWVYQQNNFDPIQMLSGAYEMHSQREELERKRRQQQEQEELAALLGERVQNQQPINVLQDEDLFGQVQNILAESGNINQMLALQQQRDKESQIDYAQRNARLREMSQIGKLDPAAANAMLSQDPDFAQIIQNPQWQKPTGGTGASKPKWDIWYDGNGNAAARIDLNSEIQVNEALNKGLSPTKPSIKQDKQLSATDLEAEYQAQKRLQGFAAEDPLAAAMLAKVNGDVQVQDLQPEPSPEPTRDPNAPKRYGNWEKRRHPVTGEIVKIYKE